MLTSEFFETYTHETVYQCDLCGKNCSENITSEGLYLCSSCSNQLESLNNGHIKDCIIKFSMGNVC